MDLPGRSNPDWQMVDTEDDPVFVNASQPYRSILSDPPLSIPRTEDLDEEYGVMTFSDDLEVDSPVHFDWQQQSPWDEASEEYKYEVKFRSTSQEERRFVCPATLRKIMAGPVQGLDDASPDAERDDGLGAPRKLCQTTLTLVYCTIEEKYPEGTLQLLFDLLQPGFSPPEDITCHLLRGILLNLRSPLHLCVQAFNLLMVIQRYHTADRNTVLWDWELLTSVVANQDSSKRHHCEVVRMLLEYVVQTLEDDYQVKLSHSALQQSIAKATLSCYLHFNRVRDVVKWLFASIVESTVPGEGEKMVRERDEHVRMVSIFQRMLSLALEVDCAPTLSCVKLSQELFHLLTSTLPLRAHRMLLLESLQSKLLRCKLVEHLLDYGCLKKMCLPMSLSLLLHFLKNCTLKPDPEDGAERWQKWDELVKLLWMLLLSYNKVVTGHLGFPVTERSNRSVIQMSLDILSKPAVREAIECFLSRAQADIGNALPTHVDESLTYLQDHLLDVCEC